MYYIQNPLSNKDFALDELARKVGTTYQKKKYIDEYPYFKQLGGTQENRIREYFDVYGGPSGPFIPNPKSLSLGTLTEYGTPLPQDLDSGWARVDKVYGNSIVWNQQVKDYAADSSNYGATGSSSASYSDDVLTFNVSETGSGNAVFIKTGDFIAGHKYYIKFDGSFENITTVKLGGPSAGAAGTTFAIGSALGKIVAATTSSTTNNSRIWFWILSGSEQGTLSINSICVFDLTLMFGSTIADAMTVEEFEAMFPLPYYAYNAGTLVNNTATALKTVGFNQWDEVWEVGNINTSGADSSSADRIRSKNFIPVFPNRTYYFRLPFSANLRVVEYDGNHNGVGVIHDSATSGKTITLSANARYIRFVFGNSITPVTTYNNDICINLSDPAKNGTYEPYRKYTLPLNLPTLTGKLNGEGESVVVFPEGLKSAGSVYDEGIVENGYLTKIVKRIGIADLGELTWVSATDLDNAQRFNAFISDIKDTPVTEKGNILSSAFVTKKMLELNSEGVSGNIAMYSRNVYCTVPLNAYPDAASFKSAMSGVHLYYELATPLVYTLDEPINTFFEVENGGSIFAIYNDDDVHAPAKIDLIYSEKQQ